MTTDPIYFVVMGLPATKGSTFSFRDRQGRIRTKDDCRHGKTWARTVALVAQAADVVKAPKGTGVVLEALCEFIPPARSPRATPCVRPDVDKVGRALMDALKGIAYEDDGQVVDLHIRKTYATQALIRVWVSHL